MTGSNTVWNFNECLEEALKYKTRRDFILNSPRAYGYAQRENILDSVCSHMPKKIFKLGKDHPNFKWSNDKLQQEALKYNSRSEFAKYSYGTYLAARRANLLDTICSHMKKSSNISLLERNLFNVIKQIYPKTQILRDRKVNIPNKPYIQGFELDIYIPELRKAIEFDGKYWHSVKGLKRSREHWPEEDLEAYHKIKDEYFKSKGIEILHVREEEWLKNKQKCVDQCLEFLEK
jgi:very-short-patch-repair endonuclease